jgi:poly(A) polymerase
MQVEGEHVTFRGHDTAGVREFSNIASRLAMSNEQREIIASVIKGHMRVLGLYTQGATDKALYRLFSDFKDNTPAVLLASLADLSATRSLLDKTGEEAENYKKYILRLLDRYYLWKKSYIKLVTGSDVIEHSSAHEKKLAGS